MLRAIETFHTEDRIVAAGEQVSDHDEIVAGREHLFEKVTGRAARKTATDEKTED
jgi:hypothetical protein